jgi:drug/metabolite transporter (DMT)-like permease
MTGGNDAQRAQMNTRGIVAMLAAMAFFTATDSLMKVATESLPPSQIIAVRGVMATVMMYLILRTQGPVGDPSHLFRLPILRRMTFEILFITSYVVALSRAPFADVFSILQSGPIMMTLFAALVWKENVGWQRWIAVALGVCGVAMILKPTPQSFDPALGLALFAAFMATGRDLSTRVIPQGVPSQLVTLSATGGMTIGGLMLAPFETWVVPTAMSWLVLLAAALAVALGSHFLILAYRMAETSAVAPFRFTSVPFAILVGWLIWGQVPDSIAMAGIVIVVGSGLYMMHRERAARRAAARPAAAKSS